MVQGFSYVVHAVVILATASAFFHHQKTSSSKLSSPNSLQSSTAIHEETIKKSDDIDGVAVDMKAWERGYSTCHKEVCELLQGEVPRDLEGTYFRNGGAKFEVGKEDLVLHPFDADGMIAAVTCHDGSATFRNRFVRTKGYLAERKAKRVMTKGTFGTMKRGGFLSNFLDFTSKNVANTNIIYWADRLLALWEGGLPHVLEPDSLRTIGDYRFKGLLKGGDTFTAHPRFDRVNNRMVSFSEKSRGLDKCTITIREMSEIDLKITSERDLTVPGFPLFHDFALTENYYVFNHAPLKLNPLPFVAGLKGAGECIEFDDKGESSLYIVPRDAKNEVISVLKVDPHFSFHIVNSYEDGSGNIVLDLVRADKLVLSPDAADLFAPKKQVWKDIDYAKELPFSTIYRYTLRNPAASGNRNGWTYTKTKLTESYLDFPVVNPAVQSAKHRFIFASCGSDRVQPSPVRGVVKVDCEAPVGKRESRWVPQPFEFMGELVFASKNTTASLNEDDGYLLTYLYNGQSDRSEFVIFDAKDVAKGPITRLNLPVSLPHGLHGSFAPGLVYNSADLIRRFKACLALDEKNWNEMKGGFSGLGITYDF